MVINDDYITDIDNYMQAVKTLKLKTVKIWKQDTVYSAYDVACAYDIETSSFYDDCGNKASIMYIWQFSLDGLNFIGRTWEQWQDFLNALQKTLRISISNRLIIYVHNLSYEFQFIRKRRFWREVFATNDRTPIKCLDSKGFEYRDSLILSGYSLEKTADNLQKYHVKKLSGYLDYNQIRTPITPLDHDEILYCLHDVQVVCAYITEQIEQYGNIQKLPMTNTGRVRKYCKDNCYKGFNHDSKKRKEKNKAKHDFSMLIKSQTIESETDYLEMKHCFQGGFTHANFLYVDKVLHDVSSYDFTSSYPYVMLTEMYPCDTPKHIKITSKAELRQLSKDKCLIFTIALYDVKPKENVYEYPISVSKCINSSGVIENNGRVAYADFLVTTVTNVDMEIILRCYDTGGLQIGNALSFNKAYLPKDLQLSILKLYSDKTTLKGVDGKEAEYLHSKGMLNSTYGMIVTNIIKDSIVYDSDNNEWGKENADIQTLIDRYNKSHSRFTYYPQGVFVTAYARRNLWTAILSLGSDYVYSDTDSVKILNAKKHESYFKKYNDIVQEKIMLSSTLNGIPLNLYNPKNIRGIEKPLGVWDHDGDYALFKTLGAKRYLTYDGNKLKATVAGIGKRNVERYLLGNALTIDECFDLFNTGLTIPSRHTGKLTHTYLDEEVKGVITGIDGNAYDYDELSCVHLERTNFEFSRSRAFSDFLKGVQAYAVL